MSTFGLVSHGFHREKAGKIRTNYRLLAVLPIKIGEMDIVQNDINTVCGHTRTHTHTE